MQNRNQFTFFLVVTGCLLFVFSDLTAFQADTNIIQKLKDLDVPENPESFFDQLRTYKNQTFIIASLFFLFTLISEDTACVVAGLAISSTLTPWSVALWGCLTGVLAGDITFFLLGYYVGHPVTNWWPVNRILTPKKLEISQNWFNNNGILVIALSRFTPGLRGPVYISAGLSKMSILKFITVHTISALIWTPALIGLAVLVGYPIMGWIESWGYLSVFLVIPVVLFTIYLSRIIIKLCTASGRQKLMKRYRYIKERITS